jgi:hypothetical protein
VNRKTQARQCRTSAAKSGKRAYRHVGIERRPDDDRDFTGLGNRQYTRLPSSGFGSKLDLLPWVENSPKLLYSYALTSISNRTTGLL